MPFTCIPSLPSFRARGSVYNFAKVETSVVGEDVIDGLRCFKIKVRRWHASEDTPDLQYLWLCPERNYHCLKEQVSHPNSMGGDLLIHEMHVDKLREIAPGLWFPARITVTTYDAQPRRRTGASFSAIPKRSSLALTAPAA